MLHIEYRQKAIAGCHDQIGHLGQDRVLELLRDRFYWPGIHMDVASYINSWPRCIRRKSLPDVAPTQHRSYPTFGTYSFRLFANRTQ